jgi:threonine dehydratase
MDLEIVKEARDLIREYVPTSRLLPAPSLTQATGAEVYLKLESEGPTFTFKTRGAIYALRRRLKDGPIAGVVTASSGNHGAAIAFAARKLSLSATIFLPLNPNPVKRARIVQEGAQVIEAGRFLEESREYASKYADEHGWHNVVDGDTEGLAIGAGTISCEITEQLPLVDTIYVPVGDSTLIRGLASVVKQIKPTVSVIGVQAERAPAYYRSWTERLPQSTDSSDTIADGLATRRTLPSNVAEMLKLVDRMQLVSDEEMLKAIYRLLVDEHVVAEPAGAASVAALLQCDPAQVGKKVVLLITGANIGGELLRRAVLSGQS